MKTVSGRLVGVNRLWVHSSLRRCGVARRFLLAVSSRLRMPLDHIAFSELTEDGEAFASRFCPNGRILMYSLFQSK